MGKNTIDFGYFTPKRFLSRATPLTVILFAAILLILAGLIFVIDFLLTVGVIVILLYIIYFVIWAYPKLKK